jgi:uncharacterized protein YecE (DUF72 family)
MADQLALFESPDRDADRDAAADDLALAAVHAEASEIRRHLPPTLHYGTSSWSFPGWTGLVYPAGLAAGAIARDGLRVYAAHPLLTTVGIDRTYYAPVSVKDLRHYASQLPAGFRACIKAPAGVTALTRGVPGRAEANREFLSVDRFEADLLGALTLGFGGHTGPILLEFPPAPRAMRLEPRAFLDRLDAFLARVPRGFEYAVELRDHRLLTQEYHALLVRHGVAHVYNYWSAMPTAGEQARVVAPDTAGFAVIRLLLRPGTWYEDERERFKPFNRIVDENPAMREDVTALTDRILTTGRRVYVLVNNKAEGSSPLTVLALARALQRRITMPGA